MAFGKKPKYKNQPVEVDGHRFDSKAEANRYLELKLLERANEIFSLELQPRFELRCGVTPIKIRDKNGVGRQVYYVGDFRYFDSRTGEQIVEDVKGFDTDVSRLKRAILEAQCGITVRLVRSRVRGSTHPIPRGLSRS